MMSYGTPIIVKVISSTVQNRQIEISGGQRMSQCWSREHDKSRKHKTKLNISEESARGGYDATLRGKPNSFVMGDGEKELEQKKRARFWKLHSDKRMI